MKTTRDTLTINEAQRLFDNTVPEVWKDGLHRTFNLLAMTTGARIGELLETKGTDLRPGCVVINRYKNRFSPRVVPVPADVMADLEALKKQNGNSFVFSKDGGVTPIARYSLMKHFRAALEKAGISAAEQRRRGLCLHSWRHFFILTMIMADVSRAEICEITGSSYAGVLPRFIRRDEHSFEDVRKVQLSLCK